MKKYGIREKSTGKILEVEVTIRNFDDCDINCYTLCRTSINDTLWLVDDRAVAEKAIKTPNIPYYNAYYDTPKHSFLPDELEVAEIDLFVKQELNEVEYVDNLKNLKHDLINTMEEVLDLIIEENNHDVVDTYYKENKAILNINYMGKSFVVDMGATIHSGLIELLVEEINDLER